MSPYLTFALSLSVLVPGILGLIKFRFISEVFHPFIFAIWIACLNEILGIWLIMKGFSTYVNGNIYFLAESVLLVLFFRRALEFKGRGLFDMVIGALVAFWLIEAFVFKSIHDLSSNFAIFYSLILFFLSLSLLNKQFSTTMFVRRPYFVLCAAFILYYGLQILVLSFWQYGLGSGSNLLDSLYAIFKYGNVVTNLLYGIALIWVPRKLNYTNQL